MAYRVVHCGTGNVGVAGLQGILNHPELELVGQYVWSPEKVGVDTGSLCDMPETGVITTDNWDELFDLHADCLSYFGDSLGQRARIRGQRLSLPQRGTNAVTISTFSVGVSARDAAGVQAR